MAESSTYRNGHVLQIKGNYKLTKQAGIDEYESSGADDSDDYYSSSNYDDSSDDEPEWQEEDLKAGELFYVEDNQPDSDDTDNATLAKPTSITHINAATYKNSMPKPKRTSKTLKSIHVQVEPASSYSHKFSTSLLANMLGIIMLDMNIHNNNKARKPNKICVDVLVPGGMALRTGLVNLGDVLIAINDICVTTENIESVLDSFSKPTTIKLTFQTISEIPSVEEVGRQFIPNLKFKSDRQPEKFKSVVTLLTPRSEQTKHSNSLKGPNGVFFLTLNLRSDTASENDDLLYSFPTISPTIAPTKLSQIRGVFVTLADIMQETFSTRVISTTLLVDGEMVHCTYHQVETEVFIICVPAKSYTLPQAHQTVANSVRLLNVMYGSIMSAFQPENKQRLDHLFRFILKLNASSCGVNNNLPSSSSYKMPGVKKLTLTRELQGHVDEALAELEASDFDDGTKSHNYSRRLYTVRGSCVFYDGLLLANHLPVEDLHDVSLFCHNHNLLGIAQKERIGLLLIWREVFRWCSRNKSKKNDAYPELKGRYFWLIVGLKRSLLCVLLQLNGNLFPVSHTPRPDINYVNHTRAALINLESCNFYEHVDQRLSTQSTLRLVPATRFMPQKTNALFKTTKPPPGQKKSQSKGFKLGFNSPIKFRGAASDSDDGRRSSPQKATNEISKTSVRGLFREKSFSSQGSMDSAGSAKQTRNFASANSAEDVGDSSDVAQITRQITAGNENSLFCYMNLDKLKGVLIMPTDYDISLVSSETHKEIVDNFEKYSLVLHQRFATKSDSDDCCTEEGILFRVNTSKQADAKRASYLQYWVVGRVMRRPAPHEFYVCFHNTSPQSMVEIAFKSQF